MTKGKSTCKLLKDIRQQIADANGISYQPKECHYEGDCAGTCPATVPLTSCQNTPKACNVESKAQDSVDMLVQGETEVMPEARTRDLKCSIAISGRVLNASSGEAASEVNIIIQGGKKRVSLGEDGRFALQVNRNDTLVFSSYGYINKVIAVKSIRNPNDMVVRLEPSLDKVGEIDREYLEKELENSAAPQSHQEKCSQN